MAKRQVTPTRVTDGSTTCAGCNRVVLVEHVDRENRCCFCQPLEVLTDKAAIEAALRDTVDRP